MAEPYEQIDLDELNCPACDAEPLMLVQQLHSDEVENGAQCTCPDCGFCVGGADPRIVEIAARLLFDQLRVQIEYCLAEDGDAPVAERQHA